MDLLKYNWNKRASKQFKLFKFSKQFVPNILALTNTKLTMRDLRWKLISFMILINYNKINGNFKILYGLCINDKLFYILKISGD